ncbi:MAG: ABC transporter ATP-binding protein [Spirochaetales bacterium]|nr:ABC transporter ATP-binding protein [Spirochaetales bacterium]
MTIENLSLSRSKRTIVSAAAISASPGEIVCVCGPNGSGKTTLLHYLAGILPCDSGVLRVNGNPVRPDSADWQNGISFVPDDGGTITLLTVAEQLILKGLLAGLERKEAAKRADAVIDLLHLGSHTAVRACDLSSGMRKRLGLALGVVQNAGYYLFDEPYGSVDMQGAAAFARILRTLRARRRTILLANYSPDFPYNSCDKIWAIGNGLVEEIAGGTDYAGLSVGSQDDNAAKEPELTWIDP